METFSLLLVLCERPLMLSFIYAWAIPWISGGVAGVWDAMTIMWSPGYIYIKSFLAWFSGVPMLSDEHRLLSSLFEIKANWGLWWYYLYGKHCFIYVACISFTKSHDFIITKYMIAWSGANKTNYVPVNVLVTTVKTSNISRTFVGNNIVDNSDVVGASPVGAAPTTSSFSTQHLGSMDWAKTIARGYQKYLNFKIWCDLY